MDPHTVRSPVDVRLTQSLLEHPRVREVCAQLARQESGSEGTRRSLLAQALRLTPAVAPSVWEDLQRCRERLQIETPVELYVYPSASFNAGCTAPEGGRVFVLVSSALLEGFDAEELRFVLGHELGHHLYNHHAIPVGPLLTPEARLPKSLVLQLFAWQRHAEVSADRAGLLCCEALDGAARSLFKLASGLRAAPSPEGIQAFLEQAEIFHQASQPQASGQRIHHRDWLSTHPFSPIRLLAARAFMRSSLFVEDGPSMQTVEEEVLRHMALMEPSYLEEDSVEAESMRRLLFAAGLLLAMVDGEIAPEEREALEELLGPGSLPMRPKAEALEGVLEERMQRVRERVPSLRRVQLLRDLTLIARADRQVTESERRFLSRVAAGLELDSELWRVPLESPMHLD